MALRRGGGRLAGPAECGELWARGYLLMAVSQAQLAEARAREGAACKHALDDCAGLQALLETLARIAAERGAHQGAVTLLGSAERVRRSRSVQSQEGFREQHESSLAVAREGLGSRLFDVAFERALAMTIDEAVAFAVEEKLPPRPVTVKSATRTPLNEEGDGDRAPDRGRFEQP